MIGQWTDSLRVRLKQVVQNVTMLFAHFLFPLVCLSALHWWSCPRGLMERRRVLTAPKSRRRQNLKSLAKKKHSIFCSWASQRLPYNKHCGSDASNPPSMQGNTTNALMAITSALNPDTPHIPGRLTSPHSLPHFPRCHLHPCSEETSMSTTIGLWYFLPSLVLYGQLDAIIAASKTNVSFCRFSINSFHIAAPLGGFAALASDSCIIVVQAWFMHWL